MRIIAISIVIVFTLMCPVLAQDSYFDYGRTHSVILLPSSPPPDDPYLEVWGVEGGFVESFSFNEVGTTGVYALQLQPLWSPGDYLVVSFAGGDTLEAKLVRLRRPQEAPVTQLEYKELEQKMLYRDHDMSYGLDKKNPRN